MGYAFVNFVHATGAANAFCMMEGKSWRTRSSIRSVKIMAVRSRFVGGRSHSQSRERDRGVWAVHPLCLSRTSLLAAFVARVSPPRTARREADCEVDMARPGGGS